MFKELYLDIIQEIKKHIIDKRKSIQISLESILGIITVGISQNNVSLHHLDLAGRIEDNRIICESKRKRVCSDTHFGRLFSEYLEIPEELPYRIFNKIKPYLPKRTGKCLLIIDGTEQSKRLYSIGALYSISPFFVGIEKQEKYGRELNASEKLIRRIMPLWKDEIDLIVGDGLYFNINDFKIALEFGKDLFIKTREQNLQIVQETESAYRIEKASYWNRVKEKSYLDIERKISYKVFVYKNFQYQNLPKPLNCYRVEETFLSDDRREVFYCITTATDLGLAEAREIAKRRWQIENNIFRLGNQACHTKRRFFRQEETNRKYLFLIYLLLSILYMLYLIGQYLREFCARNMHFIHFVRYWIIYSSKLNPNLTFNSG